MEEARRSLYNSPPSQDMEPASQVFPDIRGVEYNPPLSQDGGPASWMSRDIRGTECAYPVSGQGTRVLGGPRLMRHRSSAPWD